MILVYNKTTFGNKKKKKKSYKYFTGYLYNDHKVKQLHIMLPKTCAFIKSYDRQTK